MIPTETRPYEAAAYLNTVEECALYLQAAIEEADGDPEIIAMALDDISKARCMAQTLPSDLAGTLAPTGNPSFTTVTKVCKTLGLKLHAEQLRAT
jgi:probable addiction module antidote protein